MKRISFMFVLAACLCSSKAQAVIEHDSLQVAHELEMLSRELAIADSLAQLPDCIDAHDSCAVCRNTINTLYLSWQRHTPWQDIPQDSLRLVAEELALAPSQEIDSLWSVVDSIGVDPSLSYAQSDLRLPLIVNAEIPAKEPSFTRYLAEQSNADVMRKMQTEDFINPFADQLAYGAIRRNAVTNYALSNIERIAHVRSSGSLHDFSRRRIDRKAFETTDLVITDAALDLGTAILDFEPVTFHADKWHRKGNTSIQIAQTALSSNWYKGGDNNTTMSTYDKLVFSRYDEHMKTTLDISFELRLSGYYTAADTINPVRVNDNQLRMDVNYGYKAWKNWYYSTSFYAKTPIFDFHSANSKVTKSTFFSPLEANLGVGLEYKKQSADKRVNFNMMFAPLSYNIISVCSDRVDERQFGLEEGQTTLHQFGSSATVKLEWKISDIVSWSSRFYYFTTYEKVQLEFENTFNFQLGKYCSAKFYYFPRFDDSRDDRLECKEMLTFGLSWVW